MPQPPIVMAQKESYDKKEKLRNALVNNALRPFKRQFEVALIQYRHRYPKRFQDHLLTKEKKYFDRLPVDKQPWEETLNINIATMQPTEFEINYAKFSVVFPNTAKRISELSVDEITKLARDYGNV